VDQCQLVTIQPSSFLYHNHFEYSAIIQHVVFLRNSGPRNYVKYDSHTLGPIVTSRWCSYTLVEHIPVSSDCNKYKIDLSTHGVVITDAIKYINGKMDYLNNQEKKLLQDIKGKEEAEAEDNGLSENSERELEEQQQTETTTNGVF
jgi:hypothetical protein